MREFTYEKNAKQNSQQCIEKNASNIYEMSEINKIHNKGARKKHKRIGKNKLEPFFLSSIFEIMDSSPPDIHDQPLH